MKKRRHEEEESQGAGMLLIKAFVLLGLCAIIFIPAWKISYKLFVEPNRPPPEEKAEGYKPPPDPGEAAFAELAGAVASDPLELRDQLDIFLDTYPFSTAKDKALDMLGKVNADVFFSPMPAPEKERYVIQRGDAIARLEKRFGVPREWIMRCNNLDDPRRLRIGQVLYVTKAKFSVEVDRKAQTVTLMDGHRFFKRYKALEWRAPEVKGPPAPIRTQVRQVVGWNDGRRVAPGAKEYIGSTRWVELNTPKYTFFSISGPKPDGGIAFSDADMEELSTLLRKSVPVFIQ